MVCNVQKVRNISFNNSTISSSFGLELRIATSCAGYPVHCGGSEINSMRWNKISTVKMIDMIKMSTPFSNKLSYETGSPGHWSHYWSTDTIFGSDCEFYHRPALYIIKRTLHIEELRPYFQFHSNMC